jgi:hypothetical protein
MTVKTYDWKGSPIYVGTSKAIVIDNQDPSMKGRIRVISTVLGETGFIPYITPDDGFFSPPDVGSVVYLQCDGSDKDYPIVVATLIDGPSANPDTPSVFQRTVPTNRGWVSPGTLKVTGEPSVANGGHKIDLDDGLATVDAQGNVTHTTTSKGIRLTTSGGQYIKLQDNPVNIELEAPTIKVGSGAIEPMVLGTQWMTYMNTEIVPKLNALIAAVNDFMSSAGEFSDHVHSNPEGGYTGQPVTPGGGGITPPPLPNAAASASSAQLAVKGKVQ